VDGEGSNLENGYHAYTLLRAGNLTLTPRTNEVRIRTVDALEFLSQLRPDRTYCVFFGDYDWSKVLEDLPFARLEYLMDREKRRKKPKNGRRQAGNWPVGYGDYEVDYMPRKEFKVRKGKGPWIIIHDVGSFFQTSFLHSITLWDIGTDDERTVIETGKTLRSHFSQTSSELQFLYNGLECVLLAELMESFREACISAGYVPKKWQGPGLLAEAMFRKHDIPKTEELAVFQDLSPDSVAAFGRMAFYGGRFETSIVGYTSLDSPCVQWDLNSAYPAALQHVPCLVHGTWSRETGSRALRDDELSICLATFRWPREGKRAKFMGLPVRTRDGSIRQPFDGRGWYWSFELRSARHQVITVHDAWVYEKHCDCKPFAFLEELYRERKRIGKAGKGIVLKLAMNSCYGKLAQSVGDPEYSNPIWASFITAWCRTQINEAIHTLPCCQHESNNIPCGQDVYMIATDAIFTRDYSDGRTSEGYKGLNLVSQLNEGSELGQWTREVHDAGLFIIQPGLYFDPSASEAKFKTRGVPKRLVVEYKQQFMDAFARMRDSHRIMDGDVLLPMTLFIGIRQALHRHSLKLLGQFVPYTDPITKEPGRRTSFDWKTKRRPQPMSDPLEGLDPDKPNQYMLPHIMTIPYLGRVDDDPDGLIAVTVPYKKDIGGLVKREELRLAMEDQPDWVPDL
jgi:hypothetical protein